ncbi:type I-B CRISPR-associated protein Cas8b/Csh1 [Halorussus sp. AFM4]|uniref:type I-B CRISPR-associated protein Cas8b/Csh1 n=1 Tax=Halorussus sp. AFM4 TaxID=3421651 RepID=UPI003EB6EC9A
MSGLHAEALDEYLPEGPISSLRRIELLYGAITEAAAGEIDSEFDLYYTPGELDGFVAEADEDRYLVTVKVDLTGDDPMLDGVTVEPLQPSMVEKLGYARYPWGRGIDHSITERGAKGGSSLDTVVRYCRERLQRWTNADEREPAVGRVVDDHSDGWVIRDLQTLGLHDDIEDELEGHLDANFPSDDSPRVVTTVAVRLDPSSLEEPPEGPPDDDYYYPGQLPVLNEAMVSRKLHKLATKNVPSPSKGEGTCMVTGEQDEVFGTAEDPLAFFTVQHAEKFPRLEKVEAWRSHPVSSQAALLLQSGASLVEDCSQTRDGLRVYTLPYVVDCDPEKAGWLYDAIEDADATTIAGVQRESERRNPEFAEELRFYVIGVRNDSGDINVLYEVPNVDIYWPRRVAKKHLEVLNSSTFDSVAGFRRPEADAWRHIDRGVRKPETVIPAITGGSYARDTLAYPEADDPTTADPREWLISALLTGERVPADKLLSQYVERIGSDTDTSEGTFSTYLVLTQFAQLEALARADLLYAPDRPELEATPRTTMDQTNDPLEPDESLPDPTDLAPDGNVKNYHARKYRLERFLEERDAFSDDRKSADERRGAFLFGVFVGQLANHQSYERDMNRTVRDQHPADRMTSDRIQRTYSDVTQRSGVYASEVGRSGQLFPETENLLKDAFADVEPKDWNLPVEDVRFFYALGLAYGADAYSQARQLQKDLGVLNEDDAEEPADK